MAETLEDKCVNKIITEKTKISKDKSDKYTLGMYLCFSCKGYDYACPNYKSLKSRLSTYDKL